MEELPYGMFDADNHLYEARDAFTRHLPKKYQREFFWVTDESGRQHVILHGRFWPYIPNPTFDPIGTPGSMELMYRGNKTRQELAAEGIRILQPLSERPEYMNAEQRIARLDQQHIETSWMFPTMVSGVENVVRDDVEVTCALLRSFNRWLDEDWGFDRDQRMLTTPVISLADPKWAVEELSWALDRGARGVMLRPAPVPTQVGPRSPGDPMFDEFWGLAAEAGVAICCHAADTGYHRYAGDWTGRYDMLTFSTSIPQTDWIFIEGRAPADFITAMIVHGAIARFPSLKIVTIENGSNWIPGLLGQMKKWYEHYPDSFPCDPVQAFEANVWVAPFWEEDIEQLARLLPIERILAGSDWPHPEGLAEPTDFAKGLAGFNDKDKRAIMRDNGMQLVGIKS